MAPTIQQLETKYSRYAVARDVTIQKLKKIFDGDCKKRDLMINIETVATYHFVIEDIAQAQIKTAERLPNSIIHPLTKILQS